MYLYLNGILAAKQTQSKVARKSHQHAFSSNSKYDNRYGVFVVIWSIASLFHLAQSRVFTSKLEFAVLTVAALFTIAKPSSLIRFLIFLTVQVSVSLRVLPHVSNHEMFVLLANLSIFHAIIFYVVKRKSFNINQKDLYNLFAPLIRLELIILYFFVVLHKLNSAFFTTSASCATEFYNAQNSLSILPTSEFIYALNAYGTVLIEALIPTLLCFRRTRNIGLLIGLCFHCLIAYNPINGFYDFSSAIFAAYVVFTAASFSNTAHSLFYRARNYINRLKETPFSYKRLMSIIGVLFCLLVALPVVSKIVTDYFRYLLWTGFSIGFITLFIKASFFTGEKSLNEVARFKPASPLLWLFPVIMVINGMCPYIGLKTESSFSMFSNLRTEGGVSNHLFIPASIQIFDYQKDLVEVISSTKPILQQKADNKQLMVYFEFKHLVSDTRPEKVEYIRNGKRHTFSWATASADDELVRGNPFLLKKIMKFRSISKYEPQPCSH